LRAVRPSLCRQGQIAARVEGIYANPEPVIDEAAARLRSVPE
jgi:hypothetical protein